MSTARTDSVSYPGSVPGHPEPQEEASCSQGAEGRSHHTEAGEAAVPTHSVPRAQKRFAGQTEAASAPEMLGASWPLLRCSQV